MLDKDVVMAKVAIIQSCLNSIKETNENHSRAYRSSLTLFLLFLF
jgi:hypothetical protein